MKRTRRIEVIRYRRRVTELTNHGGVETDTAAEQAAIDVLLQLPEAVPVAPGEIAGAARQDANSQAVYPIRNGRFRNLFDWLETKLSRRNR